MDLACTENITPAIFAIKDPVILKDVRVLESLLNDERLYVPSRNYFEEIQQDIQPFMRKVVTMWMMEVRRNFVIYKFLLMIKGDSFCSTTLNLMSCFTIIRMSKVKRR